MSIIEYMAKYGMSPKDFSDKFDVGVATVYAWVNRRNKPSLEVLMHLVQESNGEITFEAVARHPQA